MDRVQIIIDPLEAISCCENLTNLIQDLERSSIYSQPVLGITLDFFFFIFSLSGSADTIDTDEILKYGESV